MGLLTLLLIISSLVFELLGAETQDNTENPSPESNNTESFTEEDKDGSDEAKESNFWKKLRKPAVLAAGHMAAYKAAKKITKKSAKIMGLKLINKLALKQSKKNVLKKFVLKNANKLFLPPVVSVPLNVAMLAYECYEGYKLAPEFLSLIREATNTTDESSLNGILQPLSSFFETAPPTETTDTFHYDLTDTNNAYGAPPADIPEN